MLYSRFRYQARFLKTDPTEREGGASEVEKAPFHQQCRHKLPIQKQGCEEIWKKAGPEHQRKQLS